MRDPSCRFICVLPLALKARLEAESASSGAPQGELMRRALEAYLSQLDNANAG